jgi:NTE family protein
MSVKVGLALGGGGARGLAHLGVLKALEQEGIPIHCIAGTSIGAIVGAMYAQNPDADALLEKFKTTLGQEFYAQLGLDHLKTNAPRSDSLFCQATQNLKRRIAINLAQSRKALLKEFPLMDILSKFIEEGNIEDTKIPLAIVATSLHTGDQIVFRKGGILDAAAASSSIPGFMCPVDLEGDLLADGGASCPVPVEFLSELGAEVTVGVEVCVKKYHPLEDLNVINIITRADMITSRNLARMMVKKADVAICPNTKDLHWSDFERVDELIEDGVETTKAKLPEIRKAIQKRLPWYKRSLYAYWPSRKQALCFE